MVTGDAQFTGYGPNLVKAPLTRIGVSSVYTPINTAASRENFNIESDGRFAIPEDSHIFTSAVNVQLQAMY